MFVLDEFTTYLTMKDNLKTNIPSANLGVLQEIMSLDNINDHDKTSF